MIFLCKEKRSFWDRNGLFFAVLSLLLSFWLILLIAIIPVHAVYALENDAFQLVVLEETKTYSGQPSFVYELYYDESNY